VSKEIIVNVCLGTGGIAGGGLEVMEAFRQELDNAGLEAQVRENCALHRVGCIGFCARDVLVDITVDGRRTTYQYIKPDMVAKLVSQHIVGNKPVVQWLVDDEYHRFQSGQQKTLLANCGFIDPEEIDEYINVGGYGAFTRVLRDMKPAEVIDAVKVSGLRGRGGAGYPTGKKWEVCAASKADQKYIICNADEGDPGSFKDRTIIEGNPHLLLEGMCIGAYGIGADKGYIYIRSEYALAVDRLKIALEQARRKGYLGENIQGSGFDFDIAIRFGVGAFVSGEETALIASIQGERGVPKPKSPYPAISGLWGKPTVINNVESWSNIPVIINSGPENYAAIGTDTSKGTRILALSGKAKNTGLVEVPMGVTIRELIFDIGGGIKDDRLLKGVHIGGPSGGCLPQQHLDLKVDYDTLAAYGAYLGSGDINVMDESDCVVNLSKYFFEFTQAESCGKCTPCRVGSKRILEILTRITEGEGKKKDIDLLVELSEMMCDSSLCGLGLTAAYPLLSALKYFRPEFEAHITSRKCPAKVCSKLVTYFIRPDQCKGCTMCARACATGAASGIKKQPHSIDQSLCVKCGACFEACKFSAVLKE
jgi:NADH:ubiquinone oxidoreductase subunit F (NADH-binding)/(2Fe-2S) ferredoxin